MTQLRPRTQSCTRLFLACVVLCAGCSEELGPEVFKTTRVEGKISNAGKPLTSGFIQFVPTEGTTGHLRATDIRPDGTFVVDGVAVGANVIGLAGVYGPTIITQYGQMRTSDFHDFRSPIRKVIPPGPTTRLEIDLLTEATAFLRDQQRLIPQLTPAP